VRPALVFIVLVSIAGGAEAQIQLVGPAAEGRPLGIYAGVEPGEAVVPPAYRRIPALMQRTRATILTWPGFSQRGDGGSRFFVQTTGPVATDVRVEQNRVVILFRNTTIHVRNSGRWLETRFFNTPVTRARLERRRRDMALVLYMRGPATPVVSSGANGAFHYTYVDFGPGAYAPVVSVPLGTGRGLEPVPEIRGTGLEPVPPQAPLREIDPSIQALDDERPPGLEAGP
jgi:hypothetical protein